VVKLTGFGQPVLETPAAHGPHGHEGTDDCSDIAYRSPEQLAGEPGDMRSDVYSLGMLATRILTGDLPSRCAVPTKSGKLKARSTLLSVRNAEPWPAAVGAVLERALASDPGDRPATAALFFEELTAAAGVPFPAAAAAAQGATSTAKSAPATQAMTHCPPLAAGTPPTAQLPIQRTAPLHSPLPGTAPLRERNHDPPRTSQRSRRSRGLLLLLSLGLAALSLGWLGTQRPELSLRWLQLAPGLQRFLAEEAAPASTIEPVDLAPWLASWPEAPKEPEAEPLSFCFGLDRSSRAEPSPQRSASGPDGRVSCRG